MKFLSWLWSLLPDRCDVPSMGPHWYWRCSRKGIRGNENIVTMEMQTRPGQSGYSLVRDVRVVMCDDCHARWLDRRDAGGG